jgi:hypothetical protein
MPMPLVQYKHTYCQHALRQQKAGEVLLASFLLSVQNFKERFPKFSTSLKEL